MGFHKSVPLLPSLTPRAKASNSWCFLSCFLALWVRSSTPKPPLFPSASMLDSQRLSRLSAGERRGDGVWVLRSRRCWQQPSWEVDAPLHSSVTWESDGWEPARVGVCICSETSGSSEHAETGGGAKRVVGGLRAGVCLQQWSSFTHPEREERQRDRSVMGSGWDVGSEVLSGRLRTAQQLCKAGSIVQTPSL